MWKNKHNLFTKINVNLILNIKNIYVTTVTKILDQAQETKIKIQCILIL